MRTLLILILWALLLVCGAKYLQCRAEHLETGEWIMDDHRLYQVCEAGKVERMDVLAGYSKNINDKGE